MNVTKQILVVPLLFLFGSEAMAVPCTATSSLGMLGPPGIEFFGNTFTASGTYTDCYTFTLAATANLQGGGLVEDPLSFLNIQTIFSLFEGDPLLADPSSQIGSSVAAGNAFSFTGLSAGQYSLVADSNVFRGGFGPLPLPVGYVAQLSSYAAVAPPDPETPPVGVPEPGALPLLLTGLAGFLTLRRQRAPGKSSIAS
jgi:hypothetical protein